MRIVVWLALLFLSIGKCRAYDPLVQEAILSQQLMFMNRMAAFQQQQQAHQQEQANPLRRVSLNEILAAKQEGLSSREIFEQAKKTNGSNLIPWNQVGFTLHPDVISYLSQTNPATIAAKTAPTPESVQDVKIRMENEFTAEAPPKEVKEVDDKKEMQRIFDEAEKMQRKIRAKILKNQD